MGYQVVVASFVMLSLFAAPEQPNLDVTARSLVPLLKDVRRSVGTKAIVEPGTLPPSPFTGRNSTLVAVRIGFRSVNVEPKVVEAMDRLLAWNPQQPLKAEDRALVERWVEELRVKVLGRLAATAKGVACDDACLTGHISNASSLFGSTKREREEARDELLLTALAEVIDE